MGCDRPPSGGPSATELISRNNLRRIGFAMHSYHDNNNILPYHALVDGTGKPLLSWRVAILPFFSEDKELAKLSKQFRHDEPWDSPQNKQLLDKMPAVYLDPRFQRSQDKPTVTYYQGFIGEGGVLGMPGGMSLTAITANNGTYQTFLVVEAGDPVPWTKPEDLVHDLKKPLPALGGPQRVDFYALFCDGHVRKVPARTDEQTIRCMINVVNTKPFRLP
jgi:hypothetical protein